MTEAAAAGVEAVSTLDDEVSVDPELVIRPAGIADLMALRVLLKKSREEIQQGQFSRINDEKLRAYIEMCIRDGACLVAEYGGAVIGSLCLRTLTEIWSDDPFLNEEWFYVSPAFRRTGAAKRLLDTAEQLADQMNVPVYIAINTDNPELVDEFVDRRAGYLRTGANFIRYPRNGQQENHDDDDQGRT